MPFTFYFCDTVTSSKQYQWELLSTVALFWLYSVIVLVRFRTELQLDEALRHLFLETGPAQGHFFILLPI